MKDKPSAKINLSIIQTELYWEDIEKNLRNFDDKIKSITETSDIIVLPEMFNTGFTMKPEKCAEEINGKTINWMKQKAAEKNSVITGSLIIKESSDEKLPNKNKQLFFNRLIWMYPDGTYVKYDKKHLFAYGKENLHYAAGDEMAVAELNGWKFKPLICYDLRFPVWAKNKLLNNIKDTSDIGLTTFDFDYDCLIYVANWPLPRISHWKNLLIARAIENQAYVVGVNRIGKDGTGMEHPGSSMIVDYKGKVIHEAEADKEEVFTAELSLDELKQYRQKFAFALDWDKFSIDNG